MLVSPLNTAQDVTLKVVTDDNIKSKFAETQLQAVDYEDIAFNNPVKASPLEAVKPLTEKFTITFSYQQQLHRTKVNVAGVSYGTPIYKVALNSRLSNESRVCWLQNTGNNWVMLLGENMDPTLVKAIISAIEDQQ